jgi:MFS family permease
VTTPETRSKTLALIGIAFSICFCIGPPIGAYFASKPLPASWNKWGIELNIYAAPAVLTLLLLVAETVFLIFALPETRLKGPTGQNRPAAEKDPKDDKETTRGTTSSAARKKRIALLRTLGRLNFFFLILFSGVEFTFTFLTFDREFVLSQSLIVLMLKISGYSIRLDEHPEWKTHRFNWCHQCSPPGRLCSKVVDESRRRQHG